jgi:DNA-binding HxlR family transcriptional regulator
MQQVRFDAMECPIARSLDVLGDWWTILVLRDVFDGYGRFDEIQRNLGIAPTMLTRRLNKLVADGLLERRRYTDRPPRDEYVVTDAGRAVRPVVLALYAWGDAHRTGDGKRMVLVDRETGDPAEPLLIDAITRFPLDDPRFVFAPGPAASDGFAARIIGTDERLTAGIDDPREVNPSRSRP